MISTLHWSVLIVYFKGKPALPYEMSRDFVHPVSFHVILSVSVAIPLTNVRDAMAWLTS